MFPKGLPSFSPFSHFPHLPFIFSRSLCKWHAYDKNTKEKRSFSFDSGECSLDRYVKYSKYLFLRFFDQLHPFSFSSLHLWTRSFKRWIFQFLFPFFSGNLYVVRILIKLLYFSLSYCILIFYSSNKKYINELYLFTIWIDRLHENENFLFIYK